MSNPDLHDIDNDIAVIGVSCRFPGARSVEAYWRNIADGRETIRFFDDEELEEAGIPASVYNQANYVKANSVLEDIDLFDASFFGYTPRQAELMDPQQRLFLETAWEALESAGYVPERYAGRIGVFAGQSWETYLLNNLYHNRALINDVGLAQVMQGNKPSNLTTRTSYKLNLTGPSMTIMTACSTSLVAVATGCQSLLNFQCDIALTGGVCIKVPQIKGYRYEIGGMVSPDGHCRAFDASADGTVFGNGVGLVALKRLEDALEDGDDVHAVIKGYAVNNDGSTKAGFTAPSVEGQSEVIVEAMASADIDPRTISLLEAHGTGTYLGDPIEIEALTQAFRSATADSGFCAIGSVKTNIGHMDSAAGIAGLIKAVLALRHRKLPPSLHYQQPNPRIDFDSTPFYVNTELRDWVRGDFPRRAGVSSLGVGGTNAHVILQEAPQTGPSGKSRPWQIIALSTKNSSGLDRAAQNLAAHLKQHAALDFADVAFTLSEGRAAFDHRRIAVCQHADDAIGLLMAPDSPRLFSNSQEVKKRSAVFMFPGQGAQYPGMGQELYLSEPGFRSRIDYCADFLQPLLGLDLRTVLYPDETRRDEAETLLQQTSITQPALFVTEFALAELYREWGIRPLAMIGHSIGEYVAACLSGVFSLDDALRLVAERGRLMQAMPEGSMLAVPLAETELQELIDDKLSMAAVNAPSLSVVSGASEHIQRLENELKQRGVECRNLRTSHAFHSAMMEPAVAAFVDFMSGIECRAPQIPFVSNRSGTWIGETEATDPQYWAGHLRHSVLFSRGVQNFLDDPDQVLVEVGPGNTLCSLAMKHADRAKDQLIIKSLRHPREQQSELQALLTTLGRLWNAGLEIDWPAFFSHEQRHRVRLPTYPFDRNSYWIDGSLAAGQSASTDSIDTQQHRDIAEWFYTPSWKRAGPLPQQATHHELADNACYLVFVDDDLGAMLARRIADSGGRVITVSPGQEFAPAGKAGYTVNPANDGDYLELCETLRSREVFPDQLLHLWSLGESDASMSDDAHFDRARQLGYYPLVFLAQALHRTDSSRPVRMTVVTQNVHEVSGAEILRPEYAPLHALGKVIPQEQANISCQIIDIDGELPADLLVNGILAELGAELGERNIAYRGRYRWTQRLDPVSLDGQSLLKQNGVYLITGGLGPVGMILAKGLAREFDARIAFVGRSWLPDREDWQDWRAAASADSDRNLDEKAGADIDRKIAALREIESLGGEVLFLCADVSDLPRLEQAISRTREHFGRLDGVIHAAHGGGRFPLISETTREDGESQFRAKVIGTYALEKALRDQALDFCILLSSNASILGGLSLASYAAANQFLDSFAQARNRSSGFPWISTNWDKWLPEGSAADGLTRSTDIFAMTPAEGFAAFKRISARHGLSQVVVSRAPMAPRLDQWINAPGGRVMTDETAADRSTGDESANAVNEPAYENEIEAEIARIWQEVLGVQNIGVHDNFFELGGDSLLFLQLTTRLREKYGITSPFRDIFDRNTIGKLADTVVQELAADIDKSELAQLITEIGELSEDDLRDALRSE